MWIEEERWKFTARIADMLMSSYKVGGYRYVLGVEPETR